MCIVGNYYISIQGEHRVDKEKYRARAFREELEVANYFRNVSV